MRHSSGFFVAVFHVYQLTVNIDINIVFVDNSETNIRAVKAGFKLEPSIDLCSIQYHKVITDRKKANEGVVLTQEQANKMDKDWKELNAMLNRLFPGRTKTECVSPF